MFCFLKVNEDVYKLQCLEPPCSYCLLKKRDLHDRSMSLFTTLRDKSGLRNWIQH